MYENITFETILKRALSRIPSTIDTREGAIVYDAIAPACAEIAQMYIELDFILKNTFGDTANREFLIRRAKERGITPYEASKAIFRVEITPKGLKVPLGSRFTMGDYSYCMVSDDTVECEQTGAETNGYFGKLIPIEYILGLEKIELIELLVPAEDDEDTESLRTRYLNSFDAKAYGGNIADYLEKTNAISGVGATKVTPVWNGGGTVKLTILDSEYNLASNELIDKVQQYIDPTKDGHGKGIAPIGHVVTVNTATSVAINITTNITFRNSATFESEQEKITELIENYLLEIRKDWANNDNSVLRIAQIDAAIIGLNNVLDIANTKINGYIENLILTNYEVPIFGGVVNGN